MTPNPREKSEENGTWDWQASRSCIMGTRQIIQFWSCVKESVSEASFSKSLLYIVASIFGHFTGSSTGLSWVHRVLMVERYYSIWQAYHWFLGGPLIWRHLSPDRCKSPISEASKAWALRTGTDTPTRKQTLRPGMWHRLFLHFHGFFSSCLENQE